jgi:uncharacterized DUF497 family protein
MESSFEWDPAKDQDNQRKHRVSFGEAQLAFFDPARVIARDASHSSDEPRFYCIGKVPSGILKVIRIIGAGYWRRGKRLYEAQAKIHR